jgi:hypothetical protein
LGRPEYVQFVLRSTGRHIRSETKIVVFCVLTSINRRDCVILTSLYYEDCVHAKNRGKNALWGDCSGHFDADFMVGRRLPACLAVVGVWWDPLRARPLYQK